MAVGGAHRDYGNLGSICSGLFGDYNEHFVQDLGSGYLGLGAVLVWAAALLRRELVQGALIGFLVFNVPHFLIHLIEPGKLDRAGYLVTNGALGFGILVALWVWRLNQRLLDQSGS